MRNKNYNQLCDILMKIDLHVFYVHNMKRHLHKTCRSPCEYIIAHRPQASQMNPKNTEGTLHLSMAHEPSQISEN